MLTIKDVANEAGVSISTVSRVMNESGTVSKKAKSKVLSAIEKLNYTPNPCARKAARKTNKLVGVLFPDITNNVFGRLIQGINDFMNPLGYNTIICETNGELEKEIHFLNLLKEKQVDGFIMANIHVPEQLLMWIHRNGKPVVLVYQNVPKTFRLPLLCSSVNIDNNQAFCDMVHFLEKMGHKSIGFIGGPVEDISSGKNRYEGFMRGMRECSLIVKDDSIVFENAFTIKDGYEGMRRLYEQSAVLPSAVICSCDNMAAGAIDFLYDNGINVPSNISITGCDDSTLAVSIRPSLTTIRHSEPEMGRKSAQILLQYIANPSFNGGTYTMPYKIIRRSSVKYIN